MTIEIDLRTVIRRHAVRLHAPEAMDPAQLLAAIAFVESGFGANAIPRHEPAYDEGGRYWQMAQHVRDLHKRWGAWAACSYGPWQILFVSAWEVGFRGGPADLWTAEGSIEPVVALMNARIFDKGAETVEEVADAWNSGTFRDAIRPEGYIRRVLDAYGRADLLDPPGKSASGGAIG